MRILHHVHRRTRGSALEPYPSSKAWIRAVDKLAIAAGIIGPAMTLPQIFQIYYSGDASGVSVFSWMAFGLLDIPLIIYGFVHKSTLIRITYMLWLASNFTVAIGAIIYR